MLDSYFKLNEHGLHEIPVVSDEDPGQVVAMLTRNTLGAAYHKRLHALKQSAGDGVDRPS